jgi:hypothetical protein
MRIPLSLRMTAFLCAAILHGESNEHLTLAQRLDLMKTTIDAYATTRHDSPPARSIETKWKVSRIDGCMLELKQSIHREEPDSILMSGAVLGISEDRVLTWTFDLADLRPESVMADTLGGPHVSIFAQGDAFHFKTDVVSRSVRRDGTIAHTNVWSSPGTASNLWIYFDAPDGDNNQLIKRVKADLQNTVSRCVTLARAHR